MSLLTAVNCLKQDAFDAHADGGNDDDENAVWGSDNLLLSLKIQLGFT